MEIMLRKDYFQCGEQTFVSDGNLSAVLFKYDTGVCGVKLCNPHGYITMLPFNGQMIWDAVFHGRPLKMKMPFDQPKETDSFLDMYGCYLMHCGALTMGCPGPEDKHLQHGELPCARYDKASVITGENCQGGYIGVTGTYEYNRAFGDHYTFTPVVKLYANSTIIDVSIKIENRSLNHMEMMYLCHINNRAVPGGKIIQAVPWTHEHMELRYSLPSTVHVDESFKAFLESIQANISVTDCIREEDTYDPEVVFFIHNPKTDKDGATHYLYVHPDGSADYTSYNPSELDHCARWIVRAQNREALGLAMPATADAEGYTAEKRKGNIKTIEPKGAFSTTMKMGYISSKDVPEMAKRVTDILK